MSSSNASNIQFGSKNYFKKVFNGTHPPAMFATPEEIIKTHELGDLEFPVSREDEETGLPYEHYFDSKEDLLDHKLEDDHHLATDIENNGFDWDMHAKDEYNRMWLKRGSVADGHHRLAAMLAYRPKEFIPFETIDDREKSPITPKEK
jgi:hypothetical protein